MTKIVLYLGYKPEGKYDYVRPVDRLEIYQSATAGNLVELTDEIDGWITKITLSEERDKKFIYILTDTEHEFEKVIKADPRWVLTDNPIAEIHEA